MNFKFRKPKHRKTRAITRGGYRTEGKAKIFSAIKKEFEIEKYNLMISK